MRASLLVLALTLLCCSCYNTARYLPDIRDVNQSRYGAYIRLNYRGRPDADIASLRRPYDPIKDLVGAPPMPPRPRRRRQEDTAAPSPYGRQSALSGELIAIDTAQIIVRSEVDGRCHALPLTEARTFFLRYARPKNYQWTTGVGIGATVVLHGFFSVLTAPLNIAVTTVVTRTAENAFTYRENKLTLDELRMFARFPQGMPEGVKPEDIR